MALWNIRKYNNLINDLILFRVDFKGDKVAAEGVE